MDRSTEAAIGLLCDLAAFYAAKNGGSINLIAIMGEIYSTSGEMGEDWDRARNKVMPLIYDLFAAYANDRVIDILKTVKDHADRIEGCVT